MWRKYANGMDKTRRENQTKWTCKREQKEEKKKMNVANISSVKKSRNLFFIKYEF